MFCPAPEATRTTPTPVIKSPEAISAAAKEASAIVVELFLKVTRKPVLATFVTARLYKLLATAVKFEAALALSFSAAPAQSNVPDAAATVLPIVKVLSAWDNGPLSSFVVPDTSEVIKILFSVAVATNADCTAFNLVAIALPTAPSVPAEAILSVVPEIVAPVSGSVPNVK